MKKIIFTLTLEEADKVVNAVAHLPYAQCFELINKLQSQASEQLKDDTRKYDDIANKKLAEVE
jgi:prephenate dehydrogenase